MDPDKIFSIHLTVQTPIPEKAAIAIDRISHLLMGLVMEDDMDVVLSAHQMDVEEYEEEHEGEFEGEED